MKKITSLSLMLMLYFSITTKSQVMNHLIPFNTQANYLRSANYSEGSMFDSIQVISGITRWTSRRPAYTAGAGINISTNNIITNTSPNQIITLTPLNGVNITGTYPNFIISINKFPIPYNGTTSGSGTYTVIFPIPYSVIPNIQASIITNSPTVFHKITNITTTGFTITTYNTINVLGLLPSYPTVNGINIDVLITEK